jgi:hypothetical protein
MQEYTQDYRFLFCITYSLLHVPSIMQQLINWFTLYSTIPGRFVYKMLLKSIKYTMLCMFVPFRFCSSYEYDSVEPG